MLPLLHAQARSEASSRRWAWLLFSQGQLMHAILGALEKRRLLQLATTMLIPIILAHLDYMVSSGRAIITC